MPLADVTAQQAFISAAFGRDLTGVPTTFEAALWVGDIDTGVEFDYPGYARVSLTNNTTVFVSNADGSSTAETAFADATGASTTDDADRWVLFDAADHTTRWAWDFLESPLSVDAAGTVEAVEVTPYLPNPSSVPG